MFRLARLCLLLLLVAGISCEIAVTADAQEAKVHVPASETSETATEECANLDKECANPDKPHLVTKEELEKYNGKPKGGTIYLSILGDVYDVSKGGEYYAEGSGYHVFAGCDGAVPFITGKFNEEESEKSTDVLEDGELVSLKTWVEFYRDEERYPFVGKLIGRYYDSEGKPTEEMQRVKQRWADYVPPPPRKRRKPKTTGDSSASEESVKATANQAVKGA